MELLGDKSAIEMVSEQLLAVDAEDTDELRRMKREAELSPDDPEVWFNLGGAYDELASTHNILTAQKAMLMEAEKMEAGQEESDEEEPQPATDDSQPSCDNDTCPEECPDSPLHTLQPVHDEKSRDLYAKALECYRKVICLEPEYYGVLCQMGLIHSYLSQNDEAIAAFKRAIEQDEDYSAAYYLGHLYIEMGDETQGRLYLQKAQEGEDSIEDLEKY